MPVSARPAVMTPGAHIVSRRKIVHDFDVRGEARARERPLEQVMAQQGRVRSPARKDALERIKIVDAFSCVRALAEQVLVDVGDSRGIGIDAARARKHALKQRTFAAIGKRRRHPRLKDRVALHDRATLRVVTRAVERMRHLANQTPDSVTRQLRVRVQRDDISDVFRGRWRCAADVHEGGVCGPSQKPVQFMELAAFALPADPAPLALVPDAPAVQQEEAWARGRRAITSIEAFNAVACDSDKFRIAFRSIDVRIDPIGQQSKVQIAFRTRQMVDLEPLHLFRDVFGRGQERGHGDERAQRFGNPAAKLEARQRNRANEKRDPSIDKRHARVNRANGAENREHCELSRAEAQPGEGDQRRGQNDRRRDHDRGDVERRNSVLP